MNIKTFTAVLMLFCIFVLPLIQGCSYVPECDQSKHGGNIPPACKGIIYRGNQP